MELNPINPLHPSPSVDSFQIPKDLRIQDISKKIQISPPPLVHKTRKYQDLPVFITQKAGEFWNPFGYKPGPFGDILIFRLKDKYNDVFNPTNEEILSRLSSKDKEMYPAIELHGSQALVFLPDVDDSFARFQNIVPNILSEKEKEQAHFKELSLLGFGVQLREDGLFLHIPTLKTLRAGWEALRKENPDLPELNMSESEDEVDDISFIEGFLTDDFTVSSSEKFIHDMLFHALPTTQNGLTLGKSYSKEKLRLVNLVYDGYLPIMLAKREIEEGSLNLPQDQVFLLKKNIDKLIAALSAFVDMISASPNTQQFNSSMLDQNFQNVWGEPYSDFWKNRYGQNNITQQQLSSFWDQIKRNFEIHNQRPGA